MPYVSFPLMSWFEMHTTDNEFIYLENNQKWKKPAYEKNLFMKPPF